MTRYAGGPRQVTGYLGTSESQGYAEQTQNGPKDLVVSLLMHISLNLLPMQETEAISQDDLRRL